MSNASGQVNSSGLWGRSWVRTSHFYENGNPNLFNEIAPIPSVQGIRHACCNGKKTLIDIEIKGKILESIFNGGKKIVSADLIRGVAGQLGTDRRKVQNVLSTLIVNRDLMYTYKLGCSFIEPAVNRPVRMSSRVVIMPGNTTYQEKKEDIVIMLEQGAAFGIGDHPSTRLAIKGIEKVLMDGEEQKNIKDRTMLDIGTGTGILAMVSVRLGMNRGVGIDIDPCAIFEAKTNIKINGLDQKISIKELPLEEMRKPFHLITANLRYPSLKNMFSHFKRLVAPGGSLVVSGVKSSEKKALVDLFTEKHFALHWRGAEHGWAGLAFKEIYKV